MWTLIILATLADQPGPLDAFRANFSSIRAEMDFEFAMGRLGGPINRVRSDKKPAFFEDPQTRVEGHWACDGDVELYRFSSSEEVWKQAREEKPRLESGKMQFSIPFVPKTEVLWDGSYLAVHNYDPAAWLTGDPRTWQVISISPVEVMPGPLVGGRGPFCWGLASSFPHVIKVTFPGVIPSRKKTLLDGHPVEVEIYRRDDPEDGAESRFEVSYDPAIGYLVRFARLLWVKRRDQSFAAREMYLADARPCSGGGFVPTEWYITDVYGDGFEKRFPK